MADRARGPAVDSGATILPPPSQPRSSQRRSSPPRASGSRTPGASSRAAPTARKRGPAPPGGEGFKVDRARPSASASQVPRPPREAVSVPEGKKVDRRSVAGITSHLASSKSHSQSSPPPKRPRPTAVSPEPSAAHRPRKRLSRPPPITSNAPSPRAQVRKPPPPKFDLADCLDVFRPSLLFRSEYEKYGNPTYTQANRRKGYYKAATSAVVLPTSPPSWADGDIGALGNALTTSERLVATIWARDVVGTGPEGARVGGVKEESVQGIEMYLIGKEFPARSVALVGIVVAVEDKTTKIIYHLDDSTAVVECSCPVDEPSLVAPHNKPRDPDAKDDEEANGKKKKKKVVEEQRQHSDRFEVGALVRIVGRITPGRFAGADLGLAVSSMVEVHDPNLETQHHLAVSQLHDKVYSQPFDLVSELALIRQEERETEKAWDGQSQAGSEAGTPRKRKRYLLPNPLHMAVADLTLPNFVAYITDHLLRHHTSLPPPSSTPSSSSSSFALSFATSTAEATDLPTPFTLISLEQNRTLDKFAQRLAQKVARDRRAKKALKDRPRPLQAKTWAANGGFVRSEVPGMKGGSARILLPPARSKGKRTAATPNGDDGNELEGDALLRATHKQFCEALKSMRAKGQIVILAADELDDDLPDVGLSPLRYDTSHSQSRDSSISFSNGGDFQLNFAAAPTPSPGRSTHRRQGPPVGPSQPQVERGPFELNFAPPFAGGSRPSQPQVPSAPFELNFAPPRAQNPREIPRPRSPGFSSGHFELNFGPASRTSPRRPPGSQFYTQDEPFTLNFANDPSPPRSLHPVARTLDPTPNESTPRAPSSSFPRQPPPSGPLRSLDTDATPRPSRTLFPSPHNPLPNSFTLSSLATPPRAFPVRSTRSPGQESWTTSLAAMDTEESFTLVTPALLAPVLLRLITCAAAKGPVDELQLRETMMRDDKWDAVAKESVAVTTALELLVSRGEVSVDKGGFKVIVKTLTSGRW